MFQESDINGNLVPASSYKYMQEQLEDIRKTMEEEGITEADLYNKRPVKLSSDIANKVNPRELLREFNLLKELINEARHPNVSPHTLLIQK